LDSATAAASGVWVVVSISFGEIETDVGVDVAVGVLQLTRSTRPRTAIKVKKTGCAVRFIVLLLAGHPLLSRKHFHNQKGTPPGDNQVFGPESLADVATLTYHF
jgi:hypothetical protein